MDDDRPTRAAEIRVHGIGNHQPFSALGSPVNVRGMPVRGGRATEVVREDSQTRHQIWFVAWTRTARAINGISWYLAVPFTLSNTAGHMRPQAERPAGGHRTIVILFGLLLTLGAYLWTVTLAETVAYRLFPESDITKVAPLAVVTAAWVAGFWFRHFGGGLRRQMLKREKYPEIKSPHPLVLWHMFLVVGTAVFIGVVRPGQSTTNPDAPCLVGSNGPPCLVFLADWTVVVAAITIVLAALLALVLAFVSASAADKDWVGEPADPWLGTGLCLLAASLSLHIGASVLHLVIDWLTVYLKDHNPLWLVHRPDSYQALLRSFDFGDMPYQGRDAITTVLAPAAWAALVVLVCRRFYKALKTVPGGRRSGAALRVHRIVCEKSAWIYFFAIASAVALFSLSSWLILRFEVQAQRAIALGDLDWQWPHRIESAGLVVGTHVILVLFAIGWFSRNIRTTVAVLGDVVGYWPVETHPSSALPYRFGVLNEASREIDELTGVDTLVVVGHSQGSVLAVDLVQGNLNRGGTRAVALVTCGSPLKSLYSRYFPREFDSGRLEAIAASTNLWVNYWRRTDPIATELGLATLECPVERNGNEEWYDELLEDDSPGGVKGHGDYWTESRLRSAVANWIGQMAPSAETD